MARRVGPSEQRLKVDLGGLLRNTISSRRWVKSIVKNMPVGDLVVVRRVSRERCIEDGRKEGTRADSRAGFGGGFIGEFQTRWG